MRTFGILVAGWLVGGALIVALAIGSADSAAGPAAGGPSVLAQMSGPSAQPSAGVSLAPGFTPMAGTVAIPVLGVDARSLTDTYAQARSGGRVHQAMDILAPRGTPVLASVDGTIRKLDSSPAGGISIYQFDRAEQFVYYYAHLDRYAQGVTEGMFVVQGTVIGHVGSTGNAPEGTPHLHFSIEALGPDKRWWKGASVNPYPLLTGRVTASR